MVGVIPRAVGVVPSLLGLIVSYNHMPYGGGVYLVATGTSHRMSAAAGREWQLPLAGVGRWKLGMADVGSVSTDVRQAADCHPPVDR